MTHRKHALALACATSLVCTSVFAAQSGRFDNFLFDSRSGGSVYTANHDSRGIPFDLDPTRAPVSAELLDRIAAALPEGRDVRKADVNLITDDAGGNITLREEAEVTVTYLHEGAGFSNSFGFIAYKANEPPTHPDEAEHVVVFPNASDSRDGGSSRGLHTGQRVSLGVFPAGTRISFFLVSHGFMPNGVKPFGVPGGYANLARSIDPERWVFYSLKGLNPEQGDLAAHTVLLHVPIDDQVILGMEDIERTHSWCDHDFNDLIFSVQSNPVTAIATEELLVLDEVVDRDRDGVPDNLDELPDAPLGAFVVTYPAAGQFATLAFEDLWPAKGDYDLNDLVLRYQLHEIRDANRDVTAIRGDFELMGRGAGYGSAFGMHFPGIAPSEMASARLSINDGPFVALASEAGQRAVTLILAKDVKAMAYHGGWCWYFNTETCAEVAGPSFSFELIFAEPIARERLTAPYNPFIHLTTDRGREVHLPNHPPTDLINPRNFNLYDDDTNVAQGRYFLSKKNMPWALNIPTNWHHTREVVPVDKGYPAFVPWAESGGATDQDWYLPHRRDDSFLFRRTLTGG